ncbi:MAG TPA: EAL domain-containing protein [Sphingomicrobium sp.]|nr:EAL domain-containing protein [Sphingomicrobium sp.]
MFWWSKIRRGQRSSDRPAALAEKPRRDPLLEAVIAHQRIAVVFQPQIDPVTGSVAGAEALARWDVVGSADELFSRAAAAGLGERLSRLVQRKALRAAAAWEGPLRALRVSINLLPQDLARAGYDEWLLNEIDSCGIDPKRVTVEITESALVSDFDLAGERLSRLRAAGVKVALDDFGTGYASFAYLAGLPLDALKVDRGLVGRIGESERDRVVVRSIMRLARELGLTIIVEGVESTVQLVLLADWGCDLYQGFLGAGALDEAELARFVAVSQAEAA